MILNVELNIEDGCTEVNFESDVDKDTFHGILNVLEDKGFDIFTIREALEKGEQE